MSVSAFAPESQPMPLRFDAGSYRDRDGRVFYGHDGEVFRALSPGALAEWKAVGGARFFQDAMADGRVIRTERVEWPAGLLPGGAPQGGAPEWAGLLRHETIPFVSYPYEWSFGMLK